MRSAGTQTCDDHDAENEGNDAGEDGVNDDVDDKDMMLRMMWVVKMVLMTKILKVMRAALNLWEARANSVRKNMYEAECEMNLTKGFRMNLGNKKTSPSYSNIQKFNLPASECGAMM